MPLDKESGEHNELLARKNSRLSDTLALVACSMLVVVLAVGSFFAADAYHIGVIWIAAFWLSIGFFATVGWDYRREFRSARFVFFFMAWLVPHLLIAIFVLTYLGWFWYAAAVVVELFLFYLSLSLVFGLKPPRRRRRVGHN